MTYNRFLYNTALYTAGREDVGAIAKSIIQAHTGPHIQAVVGGTGGLTFISDFVIQEGTLKKPPASFKFPDLSAFVRSTRRQSDNIAAFIRGFGFLDLPASIFPSDRIPDLPASIFGLFEAHLIATILGRLGQKDLAAAIVAAVANLPAQMTALVAPVLRGTIAPHAPKNLGARIHTPLDLIGIIVPVNFSDLPGSLTAVQRGDLPGIMVGITAPQVSAFIRSFLPGTLDLPARTVPLALEDMPAVINVSIPGPDDVSGTITPGGGYGSISGLVRSIVGSSGDLGALIKTGGELDLSAIIDFLGADNLTGIIGSIPAGERDKVLNSFLRAVIAVDLGATMTISENVAFLNAAISVLRDRADLGAFIRVAETFVTALLTVTTLASSSLRATIGRPGCAGGSASANLAALSVAQLKGDLRATLSSFITKNLGAIINSSDLFFAFDTIDFSFSSFKVQDPQFNATDTITFSFSPFRGQSLGASISSVPQNVLLAASITATFPLPRVLPALNRISAVELRTDRAQTIQDITLQLEGSLLEYLYVNGTEQAFIRDPNEDWKINIKSFRPIAEGLFGDHAAARVCRLGSLTSFATLDEAVRSCIQAVIGLESERDLGALITATGQTVNLFATLGVSDTFGNLGAFAGRVFPSELLNGLVSATGGYGALSGSIKGIASETSSLNAAIAQVSDLDLGALIIMDPP